MNKSKVCGDLGLARRAGKLILGETAVWELMKHQSAKLVLLANDAGKNTTKRIQDKCAFYQVRLLQDLTAADIQQAIGLTNTKVVALADKAFAKLLIQAIDE